MSGEQNNSHVRVVGAFAGIGSGLTKVAIGHGFDTVKTRMQCSPPGTYSSAVDTLLKMIRSEGALSLYKGATPPAIGWAFIDSVLMGSLHNYRLFFIRNGVTEKSGNVERLTLFGHGLAGLFAGLTSAFVASPMEMLKVRLQLQMQRNVEMRQFRGPVDLIRKTVHTQGFTGLWTGLSGSLAFRSNFAWFFLSFEAFMRGFSSLKGTDFEIGTGTANFLSGGLASFAFWIMAMPADNIKNRMMAYPHPRPYVSPIRVPSFMFTVRQVYSIDGFGGFFRGLSPCLLRAFPTNACALFVYEGLMRSLGAEQTRH